MTDVSTKFDAYADAYRTSLDDALTVTGETSSHYSRGRIAWLKRCLDGLGIRPRSLLDFGCGVGTALRYVHRALRPGGVFAFWENNPWNPGTQLVMHRCAFDREAIKIFPNRARARLRADGFHVLSTHYLFIFPAFLAPLRRCEPWVAALPIGGQYQVLVRKRS